MLLNGLFSYNIEKRNAKSVIAESVMHSPFSLVIHTA